MKKIFLIGLIVLLLTSGCGKSEPASTKNEDNFIEIAPSEEEDTPIEEPAEETELPPEEPAKESKYSSISEINLDELQQLYLDFDSSLSYSDAIEYIVNTGLPYSEEKYNGSRQIQVAFTEGCTVQKYKKENGDYLTITYVYPKGENNSNDELDKYLFGTCSYIPTDSSLQLIQHKDGYYFSIYEPGNYIFRLGTQLEVDSSMTKEEQMLYYFNEK